MVDGRTLRHIIEKKIDCLKEIVGRNMDMKEILVRAWKEVRTVEKSIISENTYIIMDRKLVEIEMLKVVLVRSQRK